MRPHRSTGIIMQAVVSLLLAAVASLVAAQPLKLVTAELPPYTFRVPSDSWSQVPGPGQGLVNDTVVEMARRIGHRGGIEYMPWEAAQRLAQTQASIGVLALTRTPEREDKYKWGVKILTDDLVLVGTQGVDVATLNAVKNRPTGVLFKSGAEALVKSLGFTRIEPAYEEWLNALKMKDRRLDAWIAPRLMVIYAYKEVEGNPEQLQFGQIIRPSEIYLAFSKATPDEEIAKWQGAFAAMQADGSFQKIYAKYIQTKVTPIPLDKGRFPDGFIFER